MVHIYNQLYAVKKLKKFKLSQETCGRGRKVQWHIVGELNFNGTLIEHFIASSESKEELLVWADMHGIIVEKA